MEVFIPKRSLLQKLEDLIERVPPQQIIKFYNPEEIRPDSKVKIRLTPAEWMQLGMAKDVMAYELNFTVLGAHEYVHNFNNVLQFVDFTLTTKDKISNLGDRLMIRLRFEPAIKSEPTDPFAYYTALFNLVHSDLNFAPETKKAEWKGKVHDIKDVGRIKYLEYNTVQTQEIAYAEYLIGDYRYFTEQALNSPLWTYRGFDVSPIYVEVL